MKQMFRVDEKMFRVDAKMSGVDAKKKYDCFKN